MHIAKPFFFFNVLSKLSVLTVPVKSNCSAPIVTTGEFETKSFFAIREPVTTIRSSPSPMSWAYVGAAVAAKDAAVTADKSSFVFVNIFMFAKVPSKNFLVHPGMERRKLPLVAIAKVGMTEM